MFYSRSRMDNITLKPVNLKQDSSEPRSYDLSGLEKLKKFLKEEIIPYNYETEARQFVQELNEFFKRNSEFIKKYPEQYQDLQGILIKLRWVALPLLQEQDVLDLFASHLTDIFEISAYSLWLKMKAKLSSMMSYEARDELKNTIKLRLLGNKERLTSSDIIIDTHERNG